MKRIFVLYVVLSICAAAFSQIKFPEIKWKSDSLYLQPIITQYFIDNKSEIWLLFLIAHSKR